MPCQRFKYGDIEGFVCSRGDREKPRVCAVCKLHPATRLCDYPMPRRKSGTCDKPLCADCASSGAVRRLDGDTFDLCPKHAQQAADPEQLALWCKQ